MPTTVQVGTMFGSINPEGEGCFRYMIGSPVVPNLQDVERTMILLALKNCYGNKTHAAKLLGVSVRTIRDKVKELKRLGYEVTEGGGFYGDEP